MTEANQQQAQATSAWFSTERIIRFLNAGGNLAMVEKLEFFPLARAMLFSSMVAPAFKSAKKESA